MYVHKKVGGKKKKCPKGNSLLLPSNDDGQPVANLFAVDYDKEALRGGVVLLKKATPTRRYDRPSVQKGFSDVMSWQSHSS